MIKACLRPAWLYVLCLALVFTGLPAVAATATTIVLVRHAEKHTDQGSDPGLTDAGQARAEALASVLQDAAIDRIYSTQLKRTWLTAMPTAEAAGLTPIQVEIASGQVEAFIAEMVQRLRNEAVGETVLVVGHSNTTPALVAALSGQPEVTMSEAEYDRLTTVVLSEAGEARVIRSRYGRPGKPVAAEQ